MAVTRRSPLADRADTASPCVSVCEIEPVTGLCLGCHRTLDEIAAWSVLDAAARRAILAALPERAHSGSGKPGGR